MTYGVPLGSVPSPQHEPVPSPQHGPDAEWAKLSPGFGDNGHRGHFGEQFIRMLAVAANLDAAQRDRDRVGVDWQLGHPGRPGRRRYPVIEAQVKCTSSPELHDDHIAFDMKAQHYNELAGRDYDIPRFLFLVLAPSDPLTWSDVTPERLLLRKAAYWTCLHDQELVGAGTSARRVRVPRGNLLTAATLHDLFSPDFRAMVGVS
ncbi:DUF4365 domain-containing protein [Streptomyces sp. NPDC056337]|uniref:DUF4365 domain-containing protein n=1 Tax=Streptomyces sp. NPDC056337 TaxID=3345787 RepID=UPI0035D71E58